MELHEVVLKTPETKGIKIKVNKMDKRVKEDRPMKRLDWKQFCEKEKETKKGKVVDLSPDRYATVCRRVVAVEDTVGCLRTWNGTMAGAQAPVAMVRAPCHIRRRTCVLLVVKVPGLLLPKLVDVAATTACASTPAVAATKRIDHLASVTVGHPRGVASRLVVLGHCVVAAVPRLAGAVAVAVEAGAVPNGARLTVFTTTASMRHEHLPAGSDKRHVRIVSRKGPLRPVRVV